MTLSIPTAGSPILDTWGAAVAGQLNRLLLTMSTADVSTTGTSATDITGLSFDVEAGKQYVAWIDGLYQCANTAQGLQLLVDDPGGTVRLIADIGGQSSTNDVDRFTGNASLVGTTTVDTAAALRPFHCAIVYDCDTDGTLQLQFARGGSNATAPGVTIEKGAGGLVVASS